MKIAILIDQVVGYMKPFANRVIYTAKSLIDDGHEVTIFCKNDEHEELKREEIFEGVLIKRNYKYFLGTTELIDKYIESHIELMNSINEKFDVYHCVDTMTWPVGYLLSRRDNAKFICDCIEYFPDYIPKEWHKDNMFKYELTTKLINARGKYIEKADEIIVVSEDMKNRISEEFRLKKEPVVIFNTRPKELFLVPEKNSDVKRKLGLRENYKMILFQGNIEESRGVDIVIECMKYIENACFVILGSGNFKYVNFLKERVKELEIEDRVIFGGFKSTKELLEFTFDADCLIYLPKILVQNMDVTIPNKFFDYLSAKRPIVFSNVTSISNIVEKENLAYIVDINKEFCDIANDIENYINNQKLQKRHIQNIEREFYKYTWDYTTKDLLKLYK